jgi:anti-sigma regulatory factor (Ser/Thr protein kinase)
MVTTARAADLTVDLPRSTTAAAISRRALRRFLMECNAHDMLGDAELATSEIVSNAIVHAAGQVLLSAWYHAEEGVLRIEVSDEDPTPPQPRTPADVTARGRGLRIVDTLTSCWGVDEAVDGVGKVVWFEIHAYRSGRRSA